MLAIDHVDRAAARFPARVAVTDGTLSITYREIGELSKDIASALLSSGVAPGEAVAILSPNHPHVLACYYATFRARCVWAPANYRNPAKDTAAQLSKFDVRWVFYHSSLEDQVAELRASLEGVRGFVAIDQATPTAPHLTAWVAASGPRLELPRGEMDDVIYIGATGGTTSGHVKGAVHTNASWETSMANFMALHRFREPPVHLVVAPLSHAAGIFHWGMVAQGVTNVLCPSADPQTILSMVERHRVTIMFLPPTVIYMVLAYADLAAHDWSSLQYFNFGAAPMSVEKLKEAVRVFGPIMYQGYGCTEALVMCCSMTPEETAEAARDPKLQHRLASAGRETPFSRIEIIDEAGAIAPPGARGEVVIGGGSLMREYYRDPERSEEARGPLGHHTGDIGYKDADGFIYLVDRKNDMIISGGFNVYPGEVEQVVMSHPAVQECVVVGAPHPKWGEMVVAAVELKPGASVAPDALLSFCREQLGGVKAPKRIDILPALPRSAVGKTLRRLVRAPYWEGQATLI